ncbi:MAG: LysM peptidoglycan-binding domain-containing protein [Anaerolineae bacterium]|nr:LysM peptidoglycan-binding domain-containing protein [Anaerolineae bacterium]
MRQRPDFAIVMFMIIIAIVLAMGVFLLGIVIQGRPDASAEVAQPESQPANTVFVANEQITLQVDPNQRPMIVPPTAVPLPQVVEQPTATPDPVVVAPEAAAAEASTFGGGGQPTTNRIIFISYQVQPGDTLFRIQTNHVTSIALMARFGISASNIGVGNVLNLPVGDPNACTPWRPYVVLQGDTAFGLSRASGISLQELQARNGLDANYSLYETEVICLP